MPYSKVKKPASALGLIALSFIAALSGFVIILFLCVLWSISEPFGLAVSLTGSVVMSLLFTLIPVIFFVPGLRRGWASIFMVALSVAAVGFFFVARSLMAGNARRYGFISLDDRLNAFQAGVDDPARWTAKKNALLAQKEAILRKEKAISEACPKLANKIARGTGASVGRWIPAMSSFALFSPLASEFDLLCPPGGGRWAISVFQDTSTFSPKRLEFVAEVGRIFTGRPKAEVYSKAKACLTKAQAHTEGVDRKTYGQVTYDCWVQINKFGSASNVEIEKVPNLGLLTEP